MASVAVIATLAMLFVAGCSGSEEMTPAPRVTVKVTVEPTPHQNTYGDMMSRRPTADWECGQISAHLGIRDRSQWQLDNGVIDEAEYATRLSSLQDAYMAMLWGESPISPSIEALTKVAEDGITEENPDFYPALDAATDACDEAHSFIAIGMLPEMGG